MVKAMAQHHHAADPIAAADIAHHVATKLGEIGQRFTSGRRDIVTALTGSQRPLSIPEILEATEGLAQSSAYRNLSVLENAGVVVRVITTDEWARYELSEDLTGHHHHMVCSKCGAVDDVRIPDAIEHDLDAALERVAKRAGFAMAHHRLDVVGVCKTCR
jgi:Fur family ferric uptake transcriptional regulator